MQCMLSHNIKKYKPKGNWYVSEKYDGIRAIWTGSKLITRSNREFSYVPPWFIIQLPKGIPLDGELLVPGKPFSYFSAISVRKDYDERWKEIVYMVFDTPNPKLPFYQRLEYLKKVIKKSMSNICLASFSLVQNIENNMNIIESHFKSIIGKGGEGVMLINKNNIYVGKRTKDLLKYKKEIEGECKVVYYIEGKGKYKGMLGAIQCETENGAQFQIGSGFVDAERNCYKFKDGMVKVVNPNKLNIPLKGNTVTYQCMEINEKTKIPRMPIYKGIRNDF